jgi:hypothetical protein
MALACVVCLRLPGSLSLKQGTARSIQHRACSLLLPAACRAASQEQLPTEIAGEGRTGRRLPRWIEMEACAAVLLDPGAVRLIALAKRCVQERASRRLDGEIYCAVHNIEDINALSNDNLWEAKRNGQVLVLHHGGHGIGWIEAPPFTWEGKYAEMLLPEGLATICKDPRFVCTVALRARALTNAPPLRTSSVFERCRG